ncbi:MAG: hypothetical protein JOZ78_08810 [Chroococcidiopsidaceae cyanobacterium CP_BM_ER_R8_30]|nr:hypothetical protein [Chroococcidiopsidaceae cyanobacterium CP_BM_ER_R8_30]
MPSTSERKVSIAAILPSLSRQTVARYSPLDAITLPLRRFRGCLESINDYASRVTMSRTIAA